MEIKFTTEEMRLDIDVLYVPFNISGTFAVDFDRRNEAQTTGTESF